MSIINIVEHNERIYDILYKPPPPRSKSPIYVSEREKALKRQKRPKTHATMGYPEVPLDPVECFLRKGGGIHPERKPAKKECLLPGAKPPVPKHNVELKTIDNSHINFRVKNIKQAIHLKPQKPSEPKLVDSPRGHRINAYDTKFKCVHHKKFGSMPKYLVRQNNEILKTEMEYKHALETAEPLCKPISVEERQALLDGLKENWAKMQKGFLLLPMLTDTIPKVLKKKKLEGQLRELEKDILLVETNPYIYIYE